jgi:hypothetical protein
MTTAFALFLFVRLFISYALPIVPIVFLWAFFEDFT